MSDNKAGFSKLVQELQDQIWLYSCELRVVSIRFADCATDVTLSTEENMPNNPQSSFIQPIKALTSVGFPVCGVYNTHAHTHGPITNPQPPLGNLEPVKGPAPVAFSICRASCGIAKSKGYWTWRMTRSDGKVRDLI